jgi:integrase/recombinase XerD
MTAHELTRHLESYLALRTALGLRLQHEQRLLQSFIDCVGRQGSSQPLRAAVAVDWACAPSPQGPRADAARRLSVVRRFLTFVRAHAPETEVPDHHLVAGARRRAPYLFSAAQLTSLLHAAHHAGPSGSLRPHTLATLVGVLASTGIRSGEALQLELPDVQLDANPPRLLIAPAKFHKARWVPLHATTVSQLRHYLQLRQQHVPHPTTNMFFLSASGQSVRHASLLAWFSQTCRRLGFQPPDGIRRPCLHSLRHTFAVSRVVRWYEAGLDVHERLPHLSVYLGHVHPRESYWYLTATPELLIQAASRFAQYARSGGES